MSAPPALEKHRPIVSIPTLIRRPRGLPTLLNIRHRHRHRGRGSSARGFGILVNAERYRRTTTDERCQCARHILAECPADPSAKRFIGPLMRSLSTGLSPKSRNRRTITNAPLTFGRRTCGSERIVPTAINERLCMGADGQLEPMTTGSARAVA